MMEYTQIVRNAIERSATSATVIAILEELVRDWEIEEPIGPDTRVVADLGFESIDLIQMVAALEQAFRPRRVSLVDMLVADGRYVDDLRVDEIVDGIDMRIRQSMEK
jgi:acyl carrier protein